jgi:predicted acyltransferase
LSFFHVVDFNKYANFHLKSSKLTANRLSAAASSSQRFFSLDVFRGATVAFMILVNNQAGKAFSPLQHAPWHGCTPTDLVFPFFLFAVGNAIAFVLPRLEAMDRSAAVWKIVKRGLLIFLIGLLLNWFPFIKWENNELVGKPFETLRIFGVLQRIALAYMFGALIIYFFKARMAFYIAALLLLGYWVITAMAGNPADPYSLEGFWGTDLDRAILGEAHMYKGEGVAFDPEGIASTIPSIAQVILGFLIGDYIRQKGKNAEMVANLFMAGLVLWLAGMAWGLSFPINKKIWTSSYVLYTVGLATMLLATLVQLIEFRGWKGVVPNFFDAFGKNPLFIYVLSGVLPKTLWLIRIPNGLNEAGEVKYTHPLGWYFQNICKPITSRPETASLLYSLSLVFLLWAIAWFMNKRRWYVRV